MEEKRGGVTGASRKLVALRPMLWLQSHHVPSVLAALIIVVAMMLVLGIVAIAIGWVYESRLAPRAETADLQIHRHGSEDKVHLEQRIASRP